MFRRGGAVRLAAAVAALALVAACGDDGDSGGGGDQADGEELVFPIGIVTSLSPPGVFQLGREAREAIEAFVEWNNGQDTGVTFEIVGVEDDKGDPAVAREAVGRLIEDGAKAILGDMSSAIATAAQPVAIQQGAIYMVSGSWADELTDPDMPTAFRVGASNSGLATNGLLPYLKHLHEEEGLASVGLLTEDSPYGVGISDQMVDLVESEIPDLAIHNEVYPADEDDVTPQLLRLSQADPKPEMVIITAIGAARNLAIPQAHEVGLAPDARLVAQWNWPTYEDFWGVVGADGVGVQYVDFEAPGTELTEMGQTMADQLGKTPSIWAQWAWDAAYALQQAVVNGETTEPQELVPVLEETSFDGASGSVTFSTDEDNYHDREKMPTYILQFDAEGATAKDATTVYSITD